MAPSLTGTESLTAIALLTSLLTSTVQHVVQECQVNPHAPTPSLERSDDAQAETTEAKPSKFRELLAPGKVERTLVEDVASQEDLHPAHTLANLTFAPVVSGKASPMPLQLLIRCEAHPPLAVLAQLQPLPSTLQAPPETALFDQGDFRVANRFAYFAAHLVHDQFVATSNRTPLVAQWLFVAECFTGRFR